MSRRWIYFVECACRNCGIVNVKIGHASDLRARLSSLRVGNPHRLKLLAAIEAGERVLSVERELHARFHSSRQVGEWFAASPELLELVASCRDENVLAVVDMPGGGEFFR